MGNIASIEGMTERQKEVCRLLVLGHRPTDICERLSPLSQETIRTIRNSEGGKAYMVELEAKREDALSRVDMGADFKSLAARGMVRVIQRMEQVEANSLPFPQEHKLITDIWDRAGFPRQTAQTIKHENLAPVNGGTVDKIVEMGRAMLESGLLDSIDFRTLGQQLRGDNVIDVPVETA